MTVFGGGVQVALVIVAELAVTTDAIAVIIRTTVHLSARLALQRLAAVHSGGLCGLLVVWLIGMPFEVGRLGVAWC